MLGALSLQGLVAAMTVEGFTDGEGFLAFLRAVRVPQLRPGQILIMDTLTAPNMVSGWRLYILLLCSSPCTGEEEQDEKGPANNYRKRR
jgi:hypothetical protein